MIAAGASYAGPVALLVLASLLGGSGSSVGPGPEVLARRRPGDRSLPAAAAGRPTSGPSLAAEPHPAVARIIASQRDGVSYGTGTLIDGRGDFALVVTNWHVVRDAVGPIEVVFPNGYRSAARALKASRDWDLAALVIWRPEITPVLLASRTPQPGEWLTIAGYGRGQYRAATGRCTQYVAPGINLPYEMVEVAVAARQGDSGGPIFNQRGELAGVLFGSAHGTTTGTYCGRIGGFLASLGPDVGRRPSAAIATAPARPTANDRAVVAVTSPWPDNPPARHPPTPAADATRQRVPVAAVPAGRQPLPEVGLTWHDLVGRTAFGRVKSVLALIGGLALLGWARRTKAP